MVECLGSLIEALKQQKSVVLKAPPGAGKTTIVPPAILDSGMITEQKILVVQPRRLAATATAARIAEIRGTELGGEIGYQVRFDKKASSETKLLTLTTGILLRRLIADPLLDSVGCIVLDEFHERSIEMDLALGMIQQIRNNFRPELRLVVMSATLDAGPIHEFLGDSINLESQGRSFPVEIRYEQARKTEPLEEQIASSLRILLAETKGDVLVFLPGVGEIQRVKKYLQSIATQLDEKNEFQITELYGSLSPQKQSLALRAANCRKVILATNVAETSITIPRVESVIDTGTARTLNHDSSTGLPKLQIEPISQASTNQRAGRAGRTSPGRCHRLWPHALQRSRKENDPPEILRGDLSRVILTLARFGERDCDAFPWLTQPPPHAIRRGKELLKELQAIDSSGCITSLGHEMVQLPLAPRLARLMLDAQKRGIVEEASIAAALLSERDPFRSTPDFDRTPKADHSHSPETRLERTNPSIDPSVPPCDLWPRVKAIQAFNSGVQQNSLNPVAAKQILRVAKQLQGSLTHLDTIDHRVTSTDTVEPEPAIQLRKSLLTAFPDRLAKRRPETSPHSPRKKTTHANAPTKSRGRRGVLASGKGVKLNHQSHVIDSDLFLCLDMESSGIEATVRLASGISQEWFSCDDLSEKDVYRFDKDKQAVIARRQKSIRGLLIHESPISCKPGPETSQILWEETRDHLSRVMPSDNDHLKHFAARVSLIREHFPALELAEVNERFVQEILRELCNHHTSVLGLKKADWYSQIKNRYGYQMLTEMNRLAPSSIQIPNGRNVEIEYEQNKPPKIAVRIQEIFGWRETPRLAQGRVALLIHLLGPNGRPQQITDDLQNFWATTYPEIKKELKRRYPKHAWPDDPLSAVATRNGLKRKS